MTKNLIALLLILCALLGVLAELHGLLLPTLSWPFTLSREFACFRYPGWYTPWIATGDTCYWFGWFCMGLLALCGVVLLLRRSDSLRLSPDLAQRLRRFRSIRRGYWSLIGLSVLVLLAAADQAVVGKRALAVEYEGKWYFPAFSRAVLPGSTFGLVGDDARAEADYRSLAAEAGLPGRPSRVLMPIVPYDPVGDAAPFPKEQLKWKNGLLCRRNGEPFDGLACRLYPDGEVHLRLRYRRGVPEGQVQGWARDRREVYTALREGGAVLNERYIGAGSVQDFLAQSPEQELCLVYYHPAPPLTGGHLLGTNSQGADILAYLYGGLQVNIEAALLYLPIIYAIGLSLGMMMGYFGGRFDLVTQRVIEMISQLPFLFVVMILSDMVPLEYRGFVLVLGLLSLFGWIRMTFLVRAAAMREKTRDYVAAARVMGAGPLHIIFRHILPNMTGIIVTLVPFSVATVVLSLTSLDYLGFGLPDTYAGWGRLLNDGLSKLSSPWIVSSAFSALVSLLLMVTFIGEAFRESRDPHRRTYYE